MTDELGKSLQDAAVATPEPAPTLAKSILDSAHKANDEFSFGMESSMNKIFKAKGAVSGIHIEMAILSD